MNGKWPAQTAREKTHCRHFIVYYSRFATSYVLYAPSHRHDSTYHVFVTLDVNHRCEWEVAQTGKIQCILLIMENMYQIYVYKCKCYCSICLCSLSKHVRLDIFKPETVCACGNLLHHSTTVVLFSVMLQMWSHGIWKEGNVLFNDALNTFYLRL